MFGSRDPQSEKIRTLLHTVGENAQAGSVQEAIAFGEVILLAVPDTEIERVLSEDEFGQTTITGLNGPFVLKGLYRF
jgi:predicted dinucleotide-binding enzyme